MPLSLEILLKSSLLLALALTLYYTAAHRSARWRHRLLGWGVIGAALLPLVLLLPSRWEMAWPRQSPAFAESPRTTLTGAPELAASPAASPRTVYELLPSEPTSGATRSTPEPPPSGPAAAVRTRQGSVLCYAIWLLGLGLGLLRFGYRSWSLHALQREALPVVDPDWGEEYRFLVRQLGLRRSVRLRYSTKVATPLTFGALRPVVLLPTGYEAWDQATRQAVLLHELNHVKHHDYAWHRLAELVGCAYWFHPLYHWLRHRLALEREQACDEGVLANGVLATQYATVLLAFAKQRRSITFSALAMARPGPLRRRLEAILASSGRTPKPVSRSRKRAVSVLAGGFFLSIALAYPVSVSQLVTVDIDPEQTPGGELRDPVPIAAFGSAPATPRPEPPAANPPDFRSTVAVLPLGSERPGPLRSLTREEQLRSIVRPIAASPAADGSTYYAWSAGAKTYRVWLKGAVDIYDFRPYLNPLTDQAVAVVELRHGSTTRTLVLSRAPYAGALVQTYVDGSVNSYSGFAEQAVLTGYYRNGDWVPLGQGVATDLRRELATVAAAIRDPATVVATEPPQAELDRATREWRRLRQRYLAENELPQPPRPSGDSLQRLVRTFAEQQYGLETAPPYAPAPTAGTSMTGSLILGSQWERKVTTGWSGDLGSDRFYRVRLPAADRPVVLRDFNFHLRFNLFREARLRLDLYALTPRGSFRITPEGGLPVALDGRTGWHSVALANYRLEAGHTVLAQLTMLDGKARRDGGGLFFSHARDFVADPEAAFAEYPLAWYCTTDY